MENVIAKITETDSKYVSQMIQYFGLKLLKDGFVECPSSLIDKVHGLEEVQNTQTYAEQEPEVVEFLNNYPSGNSFFDSLKKQLANKGSLSVAQTMAVIRAIEKSTAPREFSLKVGQTVRVGAKYGRMLYINLGFSKPLFNFEIMSVTNETAKSWEVTVKGSFVKNGYCPCCGLKLTDPVSIASNVGPVCAANWGIPYGDSAVTFTSMAEAMGQEAESGKFWLAKSMVKDIK